jgi:hypothetical protein
MGKISPRKISHAVLFRFYGPEQPLFAKTWKPPDIELVAAQ